MAARDQKEQNDIRDSLNADIEAFLASGGRIQQIPMGVSGEPVDDTATEEEEEEEEENEE